MNFLVVWSDNDDMVFVKVDKTKLFKSFEFKGFINQVIQFTQKAGVGDCIHIGKCLIIRTN